MLAFRCSVSFSSMIATPSVDTWLEWLQLWASMDPTPWSRLRQVWLNRLCQPSRLLVLTVLCLQVDHWLEFSAQRLCGQPGLSVALAELDRALSLRTFLVGHALTLADISVWASLKGAFLDLFWWTVCVFTQLFHQNCIFLFLLRPRSRGVAEPGQVLPPRQSLVLLPELAGSFLCCGQ